MELMSKLKSKTSAFALAALLCGTLAGGAVGGTYALWQEDTGISVSNVSAGDLDVEVVENGLHFEAGDYRLPLEQRNAQACAPGFVPKLGENAKSITFGSFDGPVTGVLPVKIRSYGDNIAADISVAGAADITGDQKSMKVEDFKLVDAEGNEVAHVNNTGDEYKDYFVKFVVSPQTKPAVGSELSTLNVNSIRVKIEQVKK